MAGFSEHEMAVLAAIADTFVAGDGEARARLAAEALERVADPSQLRQLRLVLRLMDSGPGTLFVGGPRWPMPPTSPRSSR